MNCCYVENQVLFRHAYLIMRVASCIVLFATYAHLIGANKFPPKLRPVIALKAPIRMTFLTLAKSEWNAQMTRCMEAQLKLRPPMNASL